MNQRSPELFQGWARRTQVRTIKGRTDNETQVIYMRRVTRGTREFAVHISRCLLAKKNINLPILYIMDSVNNSNYLLINLK